MRAVAAAAAVLVVPAAARAHVIGTPHSHHALDSDWGGVAPWLVLVAAVAALLGVLSLVCFIRRRAQRRPWDWD